MRGLPSLKWAVMCFNRFFRQDWAMWFMGPTVKWKPKALIQKWLGMWRWGQHTTEPQLEPSKPGVLCDAVHTPGTWLCLQVTLVTTEVREWLVWVIGGVFTLGMVQEATGPEVMVIIIPITDHLWCSRHWSCTSHMFLSLKSHSKPRKGCFYLHYHCVDEEAQHQGQKPLVGWVFWISAACLLLHPSSCASNYQPWEHPRS